MMRRLNQSIGRTLFGVVMACAVMAVIGCSPSKTAKPNRPAETRKAQDPTPLAAFQPHIKVERLWVRTIGRGEKRLGYAQHPVVADGRVYAAAVNHGIYALDLETGHVIWHVEPLATHEKSALVISGGPAVGGGRVVFGTLDGQVIALDSATGSEQWRTSVTSEIISAPSVDDTSVYIHSVDGKVTAMDAASGAVRWSNDHEPPSLSVRGNSSPLIGPGVLFIGHDDGSLSTVSSADGHTLSDQIVGSPEGRTEIERMADVDGQPVLEGDTLYATSYKNATIALDAPNARVIWTSSHGGQGGVGVSSGAVVVTSADGSIWGLDKTSGAALWSQMGLLRRAVSPPAIHGDYAVVGDYKGYVHWLNLFDGAFAARLRLGHAAIVGQPVISGEILLVQTTHGQLAAYRLHS